MNLWNENPRTPLVGMQLAYGILHLENGRKLGNISGKSIKVLFLSETCNISTVKRH